MVGLLFLENDLLAGAFTPDRLVALELLATQAAISLQNARLLAKERAALAQAAFLAEAGAVLSESLDYEKTFARIGRLCVRELADWCAIDILEGQEIRRLAVAHRDPTKEPILREVQTRYPPRWDSPHPAIVALRTGEPVLTPEMSDDSIRAICHNEEHQRLARALGLRTALSVPLIARGQTLGVLSLASDAPGRRYGRADLEVAVELGRRAAIAIDNARLYRASQRVPSRPQRVPLDRIPRAQDASHLAQAFYRGPSQGGTFGETHESSRCWTGSSSASHTRKPGLPGWWAICSTSRASIRGRFRWSERTSTSANSSAKSTNGSSPILREPTARCPSRPAHRSSASGIDPVSIGS